jgi:biotin transporter BioY
MATPVDTSTLVMLSGFAFVGVVTMAVAGWMAWRMRRRERAGCVVAALVVAHVSAVDEEGTTIYYPVFEFHDRRGTLYRVQSSIGSAPARHAIGQRVEVSYDAERPEQASEVLRTWMAMAAALGGALIVGTALLYVVIEYSQRHQLGD